MQANDGKKRIKSFDEKLLIKCSNFKKHRDVIIYTEKIEGGKGCLIIPCIQKKDIHNDGIEFSIEFYFEDKIIDKEIINNPDNQENENIVNKVTFERAELERLHTDIKALAPKSNI